MLKPTEAIVELAALGDYTTVRQKKKHEDRLKHYKKANGYVVILRPAQCQEEVDGVVLVHVMKGVW